MFNNYLKITWRNLLKNKTFSIINLVGLSVGIAAFLLIINYLGDQRIIENGGIFFVDRDMFDIFSFTFKLRDSKNVFKELNDAIITEETAIKYFGKNDPLGKSLKYANEDYIVKGVLEDIPVNSHIRFNILLNYDNQLGVVRFLHLCAFEARYIT